MRLIETTAGEQEVYISLKGKDGKKKLYQLQSSSKKFTAQLGGVAKSLASSIFRKLRK